MKKFLLILLAALIILSVCGCSASFNVNKRIKSAGGYQSFDLVKLSCGDLTLYTWTFADEYSVGDVIEEISPIGIGREELSELRKNYPDMVDYYYDLRGCTVEKITKYDVSIKYKRGRVLITYYSSPQFNYNDDLGYDAYREIEIEKNYVETGSDITVIYCPDKVK